MKIESDAAGKVALQLGDRKMPAGVETDSPPLTAEQFEATPDFARFKVVMKRLLAVPKPELDRKVRAAKRKSPRAGNPNAPGRKRKVTFRGE
jgi:hypothetical protein